jgi:hypothetical protein
MQYLNNITGRIYTSIKYFKQKIFKTNRYKLTKRIIHYIQSEECSIPENEKRYMLKCFSNTLVYPIGYHFIREYLHRRINVLKDETNSLYYTYHNKKKLYFKRGLTKK